MSLEAFLTAKADEIAPLDADWPDYRRYAEETNDDALSKLWLENNTSYIWRVGVLAQWDSNKCDYAHVFIGHEREPGKLEFIGTLFWQDGENDDIGRCLRRVLDLLSGIHPVFDHEPLA